MIAEPNSKRRPERPRLSTSEGKSAKRTLENHSSNSATIKTHTPQKSCSVFRSLWQEWPQLVDSIRWCKCLEQNYYKATAMNENQMSAGVRSINRRNGPASQRIWSHRSQGFKLDKAASRWLTALLRSSFMPSIEKVAAHPFLRQQSNLARQTSNLCW